MTDDQVKKLEELTKEAGELIKSLQPKTAEEWEAHDKLTAAHKQMRSIDLTHLTNYDHI